MESYLLPDGPQTPSKRRPTNKITQNRITEHLLMPSIILGSGDVMGGAWYESGLSTPIPISFQCGRKLERLHRRGWRGENSHFIDSLAAGNPDANYGPEVPCARESKEGGGEWRPLLILLLGQSCSETRCGDMDLQRWGSGSLLGFLRCCFL